jgi:hypothetical protein
MCKVHPKGMVAHLWANRSQPTAYTASRNLYFDGAVIYSYGEHFPIARHVTIGKGKRERRCVLFTSQSSTVTTTQHMSIVRRAIPSGLPVFTVPHLEYYALHGHGLTKESHADNLKSYGDRILERAKRAKRARVNGDWLAAGLVRLVDEANAYAKFFGLRKVFKVPSDTDLAAIRAKAIEAAKQENERRKAAAAKRAAELAEAADKWKRGEIDFSLYGYPSILLRVRGSYVQTSQGAVVPLEDAKRLLPLVRSGKAWYRNGQTIAVGSFQLDSIDAAGNIKVGCHYIERQEIERIAAQLGL